METASQNNLAKVEIDYAGYWLAIDYPITLWSNGNEIATFSMLQPFRITIPAENNAINLKAKMKMGRTAKLAVKLQPGMTYKATLIYGRLWGSLKFKFEQK